LFGQACENCGCSKDDAECERELKEAKVRILASKAGKEEVTDELSEQRLARTVAAPRTTSSADVNSKKLRSVFLPPRRGKKRRRMSCLVRIKTTKPTSRRLKSLLIDED
jgi:hypothetical protein